MIGGMLTALTALLPSVVYGMEILGPSSITAPRTVVYPSMIHGPSEIVFPEKITFPSSIRFPSTLRFPRTVTYPARVATRESIIVTEADIPSLDPLTVKWLLGEREDPMVPMRVLPDGRVVPLLESSRRTP